MIIKLVLKCLLILPFSLLLAEISSAIESDSKTYENSNIVTFSNFSTFQFRRVAWTDERFKPGEAKGGVTLDGVKINNSIFVPLLEDKDADGDEVKAELKRTGFSLKVTGHRKSQNQKKGLIISQKPVGFSQVSKPGLIYVIVSDGP